ncbi:MAG: hypothetical protein AAFX40_14785, partial [Cyanobacteria bacterium J06639_1]
ILVNLANSLLFFVLTWLWPFFLLVAQYMQGVSEISLKLGGMGLNFAQVNLSIIVFECAAYTLFTSCLQTKFLCRYIDFLKGWETAVAIGKMISSLLIVSFSVFYFSRAYSNTSAFQIRTISIFVIMLASSEGFMQQSFLNVTRRPELERWWLVSLVSQLAAILGGVFGFGLIFVLTPPYVVYWVLLGVPLVNLTSTIAYSVCMGLFLKTIVLDK